MIEVLVICCLLITGLHGFETGAAQSACTGNAMVPSGHGVNNAQGTSSPYSITVSAEEYNAGGAITG